MYVPTPPTTASPRVRELAHRIVEVVRNFRQNYPDLTGSEISQALTLARTEIRSEVGGLTPQKLIAVLVAGLLVLGLALMLYVSRSAG